jgi:hypothetical protein
LSHVVQIKTEIRDPAAVAAACRRLGLAEPIVETVRLFSAQATGLAVRLSGWRFPVVCDLASGQLQYDDYGGRWGEKSRLDAFFQAYAVEMARIQARKQGHSVTEQQLADGSIKLTFSVSGGAT